MKCLKCNKQAIWFHKPSNGDSGNQIQFCDDCVPRGCFCNINPFNGEEDRDHLNRLFPCSKYIFENNE